MKPLVWPDDYINKIICGDCLEVMQGIPDGAVDLVVTDPPYCSGAIGESQRTSAKTQGVRNHRTQRFSWFVGDNMSTAGLAWMLRHLAIEIRRITIETGSAMIFCDWRMLSSLQPAIESANLRFQNLIIWDKKHFGMGLGFRNQHELIMHFTIGSPVYYSASVSNVLSVRRISSDDRIHQTQKPVELIAQLLRVCSTADSIILDPFVGSGTTCVAAKQLGRKYIGIEINPDYCKIAEDRLRQEELF